MRELIELARREPGTLTLSTAGQGSSAHLAVGLFMRQAGKIKAPARRRAYAFSGQRAITAATSSWPGSPASLPRCWIL
nr:tripartite tricarboxylate transporter substrate-binding protein [Bordetella bronchiseptica]